MTEFTGESDEGFGVLGFLAHLFISLGVLVVIVSLFGWQFAPDVELFGTLIGGGGASVLTGIAIGFLNILLS